MTEAVEVRDSRGVALAADMIDGEIIKRVEASIASGRCVLIHLLDCSKTNLTGLRRSTASDLLARYSGRIAVVVDSCQLRCSPEQIRADLQAGFMVMITGSKFAAGPPFAGAILLPCYLPLPRYLDVPVGMFAYTAANDWPFALHERIDRPFPNRSNLGMGLRWEAALAELERFFALPALFRASAIRAFGEMIEGLVVGESHLRLVDRGSANGLSADRTIFPIATITKEPMSVTTDFVYRSLRTPLSAHGIPAGVARGFHVGQPVPIGDRIALRVCLSAAHVVDAAERSTNGRAFDNSIAPLLADLDDLFSKWRYIVHEINHR